MVHLDLVELSPLMAYSSGRRDIMIGLLDGPVAIHHPLLAVDSIRELRKNEVRACARADSWYPCFKI